MTVEINESLTKAKNILGLQFLSEIGDSITFAIISLSVLEISQSTRDAGLVYFIELTGLIIFTFIGGFIGDKFCRKKVLVYADIGRAIVVLFMILAFKINSLPLIYFAAFLLSILGALHNPAFHSASAQHTPDSVLRRFNSLERMAKYAAAVVGAIVAGIFVKNNFMSFGFLLDSLTFLVCAIGFAKIVTPKNSNEKISNTANEKLFDGFKILLKNPGIRNYALYDSLQMLSFGAFNTAFFILAQRDFGWSPVTYSYHLAVVGFLTFLGGWLGATNLINHISDRNKLLCCSLVSAAAYLAMLYFPYFPYASILIGICDGLAIMTVSVTRTYTQIAGKRTFPRHISSLLASRRVTLLFATLMGSLTCIVIDDYISLHTTFKFFVVPLALSAIPILWPWQGQREFVLATSKIVEAKN